MNNQVYGLTKGQAAPTAHSGLHTPSTPDGKKGRSVNPLKLAIAAGASFVGRGVSWQRNELAALMTTAINTNGFSLVDVFSPCVTWHREPGFRGSGPIFDWYKQNFVLDIKDAWQSMRDQVFSDDERAMLPVDYDPKSPEAALSALRLIPRPRKSAARLRACCCTTRPRPPWPKTSAFPQTARQSTSTSPCRTTWPRTRTCWPSFANQRYFGTQQEARPRAQARGLSVPHPTFSICDGEGAQRLRRTCRNVAFAAIESRHASSLRFVIL